MIRSDRRLVPIPSRLGAGFGAMLAVAAIGGLLGAQAPAAPQGSTASKPPAAFPGIPTAPMAPAAVEADDDAVVAVKAVAARTRLMPGDRIPVAIVFDVKPSWHIWTSASQADALPSSVARFDGAQFTGVAVDGPTALVTLATGAIQWPDHHLVSADFGDGPQQFAVYEGRAIAYLPLIVAADAKPGTISAALTVSFQACNDRSCMFPETARIPLQVEVVTPGTAAIESAGDADPSLFASFDAGVFGRIDSGSLRIDGEASRASGGASGNLLRFQLFDIVDFTIDTRGSGRALILLMAFLGGLLLNLTPCVLPVIPLKVMSLQQSAGNRARCILLGAVMSAGVIAFWLALGAIMASLTGVDAISVLFQNPWVTIGIGAFLALMAVAMGGLFSFALPTAVYSFEPKHDTMGGSFMMGIMAAVLSTPCTGPFMGASLAWARAIDSPVMLLLIFAAIGAGMASPYLFLSAFPQLVKRVPKAGPASEMVKQVMGLLLLAAAFYFLRAGLVGLGWIYGPWTWWMVVLPAIAAGLWLMWGALRLAKLPRNKLVIGAIGALLVSLSAGAGHVLAGLVSWPLYSPVAEKAALAGGRVLVIKFTADWCISCKVLERTVLASRAVTDRLSRPDVQVLSVDLTGGSAEQAERLKAAGSATIPLLVVLAPDGQEVFRSDAYKPQQVIDAVDRAAAIGIAARGGAPGRSAAPASTAPAATGPAATPPQASARSS